MFVVGPDKKIKLVLVYPMTTGRNFDEVLQAIDSLQLTAKHKVATPVNWKHGEDVIIAGSVSDEDAKKTYPQGWKAPKPYMHIVPSRGNCAGVTRGARQELRSSYSHADAERRHRCMETPRSPVSRTALRAQRWMLRSCIHHAAAGSICG